VGMDEQELKRLKERIAILKKEVAKADKALVTANERVLAFEMGVCPYCGVDLTTEQHKRSCPTGEKPN
jgi:hypothetical protein